MEIDAPHPDHWAKIGKVYREEYSRGWAEAIEAAAAEMLPEMAQTEAERSVLRHRAGEVWEFEKRLLRIETAIRKLKKCTAN